MAYEQIFSELSEDISDHLCHGNVEMDAACFHKLAKKSLPMLGFLAEYEKENNDRPFFILETVHGSCMYSCSSPWLLYLRIRRGTCQHLRV